MLGFLACLLSSLEIGLKSSWSARHSVDAMQDAFSQSRQSVAVLFVAPIL
jgi:hypothetical protein